MLKPFIAKEYIYYSDIDRQPFNPISEQGRAWSKNDDKRLLLLALDRYAEYLRDTSGMSDYIRRLLKRSN